MYLIYGRANFETYARMSEIIDQSSPSQAQLLNELRSEIVGRAITDNSSTVLDTEDAARFANNANWVCQSRSQRKCVNISEFSWSFETYSSQDEVQMAQN
jgi:hypothetical protein